MISGTFFLSSIHGAFRDLTPGTKETLAVFVGLLGVLLVFLVWIIYFRRPSRGHRHHHHSHSRKQNAQGNGMKEPVAPAIKKRKVRRTNHPQRFFNPTLAQTHGLPPLRNGQQETPPSHSS